MKLYRWSQTSPPSPPCPPGLPPRFLSQAIGVALAELGVVKAPDGITWLVAGPSQAADVTSRSGVDRAHVWTIRELESLSWDQEPPTLAACVRAFESPASGGS